jgi:LssY C-terminus
MSKSSKPRFSLSLYCLIIAGILAVGSVALPAVKARGASYAVASAQDQKPEEQDASGADSQGEAAEDELAPAAFAFDISKDSPLIRELYQATRATKEQDILAQLAQAKKLLDDGADVKATDAEGRTALHWAVFGSSYNIKPKVLVAYEEIADTLIARGVDINREDVYQDTALDYLLYSPSFEMQTLLIENGASSGFLAASFHFVNDEIDQGPSARAAKNEWLQKGNLLPGLTLSVRLDGPVYSDRSRTGDPVTATVTYPLCKNGEQVACTQGELLVPPGTKVNGTVLFAQKAPDKYSRPRLVLDFSNIVHSNGQRSPLYTHVLDVDNARETILNNEILGIIQPHASGKVSLAMAALSAANPIAGYTIKGVQTVYGLSIRREIFFPSGTDMQLQIVRPSILKQREPWPGWPRLTVDDELRQLVSTAPLRTSAKDGTPSDPTNLMFLGTQKQVQAAFGEAGWFEADDLSVRSALKTVQATARQTGYSSGPVSTLLLSGQPPDMIFQKSLDTFAKRHHLRVWKLTGTYNGQDVWIGAATHDIATTNSKASTKWAHRIDPHIDRERDWVETDLLFIGTGKGYADVDRPAAPRKLSNATGDEIVTDGKISVVQLANLKAPANGEGLPALTHRP